MFVGIATMKFRRLFEVNFHLIASNQCQRLVFQDWFSGIYKMVCTYSTPAIIRAAEIHTALHRSAFTVPTAHSLGIAIGNAIFAVIWPISAFAAFATAAILHVY